MDELTLGFDTEGHALSIRFPTAEAAEALKKRVATGVVAASLVAGGAAAGVALAPSLGRTTTVESGAANVPAMRDTDRYTGTWSRGASAPAVHDADHFIGDWTPMPPGAHGAPGAYRQGPASSETAPGAGGAPGAYRPGPSPERIQPPQARQAR